MSRNAATKIYSEPMANLKLIERSGKTKKDPSPLTSAMAMMGTKYPLTIDKAKAIEYKIPQHFLLKGKRGIDTHTYGRQLCKKEAIEWWVQESPLPNQENLKAMKILFQFHQKEVDKYYSINWREARIKMGSVIVERRLVPTQSVAVDASKRVREDLLKECLFPDYTIPSFPMSSEMIMEVKSLLTENAEGKVSLQNQMRIVLNQMDPKMRVLPIQPGVGSTIAPFKHAVMHSNLVITNIRIPETISKSDYFRNLCLFTKALICEARIQKFDDKDLYNICQKTTISGRQIEELIFTTEIGNSVYYKFLRAIYKMEDSLEFTEGGLTVCAYHSRTNNTYRYNKSKVSFPVSEGTEKVHFKYEDLRGSFVHNGGILYNIVSNYTNREELTNLIAGIAAFIYWGGRNTRGKTLESIRNEIRTKVQTKPWEVIIAESKDYMQIRPLQNNEEKKIGILTLNSNTEYITSCKVPLNFAIDFWLYKDLS